MNPNDKVEVISTATGRVGVTIPELRFKRVWEQKGAKIKIDFGVLEEAIYDPGVEYLFNEGILYIEDMKAKQALGLEPTVDDNGEAVLEPVNVIKLTDALMKRALGPMPVNEFKDWFCKLTYEQKQVVAQFAVENEITNFDKSDIIEEETGIKILSSIQLNRQSKEV